MGILKLLLKIFYLQENSKSQKKWQRDLPLGELVSDRWERASRLGFGVGTSIYESAIIYGNVVVGKNTWIGPHVVLDGSGDILKIGDNCNLSAGVQIYTHDSILRTLSNGDEEVTKAPVIIGNNCYLGPNVVVSKGVSIGDSVIIGANSFLNSNIPSNCRAWGNPAKIVDGGIAIE